MPCGKCKQPWIVLKDGTTRVCITCDRAIFGKPKPVPPSLWRRARTFFGADADLRNTLWIISATLCALAGLMILTIVTRDSTHIPGALYARVDCTELDAGQDHCAALWMVGDHSFDIHVEPGQCAVVVNGRCAIRAATGHVRVESVPAGPPDAGVAFEEDHAWHAHAGWTNAMGSGSTVTYVGDAAFHMGYQRNDDKDWIRVAWNGQYFEPLYHLDESIESPSWCVEDIHWIYRDIHAFDPKLPWTSGPCKP